MLTGDSPLRPRGVLVVGIPESERDLVQTVLSNKGLLPCFASSMSSARETMRHSPSGRFDCAILNGEISGKPGIECASWLLQQDSGIACLLLVEVLDSSTLLRSLRLGVCDVLARPLVAMTLDFAVERALYLSRSRRGSSFLALQARDATRINRRLMNGAKDFPPGFLPDWSLRLEQAFFPAVEAGGDFSNVHALDDHRLLFIAGDVSGHDVVAGFISSFFIGMTAGMLACEASPEKIFAHIQHFLVDVWNARAEPDDIPTSLSAAFVIFDFAQRRIHVSSNGFPSPIFFTDRLEVQKPAGSSPPLGWFRGALAPVVTLPLSGSGSMVLHSDGLVEMGGQEMPCLIANADAVLGMAESGGMAGELGEPVRDDIFALRFSWDHGITEDFLRPLCSSVCEVAGPDDTDIDGCQQRWNRMLQAALPRLSSSRRQEILLACREAALNVIEHVRTGRNSGACRATMALVGRKRLRVVFRTSAPTVPPGPTDKGAGHIPFGMKIINAYSDRVEVDATDHSIHLEFRLDNRPLSAPEGTETPAP